MKRHTRTVYPTYLFKDHDPVLDLVDYMIESAGMSLADVAHASGMSVQTLRKWRQRKTKAPMFQSVAAVTRATGAELAFRRASEELLFGKNRDGEIVWKRKRKPPLAPTIHPRGDLNEARDVTDQPTVDVLTALRLGTKL